MRYTQKEFGSLLGKLSGEIYSNNWKACLPLVEELKQSIMIKLR